MKSLEAFTLGKRRGQPETNEDSLVILPDIGYAVIDGVTDRNGTLYRNMLAGRFASRTSASALTGFLRGVADGSIAYEGSAQIVALLTKAVATGYAENGSHSEVAANPNIRAGCAVVVAFVNGESLEVVSVGDSGIRINGGNVIQGLKPLDDVTGRLRREAWSYFEALGYSPSDCERFAASVTWQGTKHQPAGLATCEEKVAAAIEARALAVNRQALPEVPEWELLELIHHGIANGQGAFQNTADRMLGYGVIDGFDVPAKFIETISVPLAELQTIELFSDGYFSVPAEFGIAAWEAEFDRVEREDPHKIGRYMSTKGTTETALTDDRTYLGVRWK